jgi:hypothetical protein
MFGLINSFIDNQQCAEIIHKLKLDFPDTLQKALNHYKDDKDFILYIRKEIDELKRSTDSNILVLFWLEIIELNAFIGSHFDIYSTLNNPLLE